MNTKIDEPFREFFKSLARSRPRHSGLRSEVFSQLSYKETLDLFLSIGLADDFPEAWKNWYDDGEKLYATGDFRLALSIYENQQEQANSHGIEGSGNSPRKDW